MEGRSMNNDDERGALEETEIDPVRLAILLRNAIQHVHSGNEPTDGD